MPSPLRNFNSSITSKKQTGVAIITALLIIMIAATVSITISTQLQLDIRRTGNLIALDQADTFVALAEKITNDALKNNDDFNNLMDILRVDGIYQAPLNIDNGSLLGEITDLNSCINLNTLITDQNQQSATINTLAQERLQRLFDNNDIRPAFITALFDWIDEDSTGASFDITNSAEDGYYLNLETGRHTANRPLTSITEIRLIKGSNNIQDTPVFDTYNKLKNLSDVFPNNANTRPSICAFDISLFSPQINVNTASEKVLLALSSEIEPTDVDAILACRDSDANGGAPFTSLDDFYNCGGTTNGIGTKITGADRAQLGVTSEYFLLKTTVNLGSIKKSTYSIIFRDDSNAEAITTQIISRTQRTL